MAAEQDEWDKPSASSITLRVTVLDEAQVPTVFAPQVLIDVEVPCRLAHFAAIARQFVEEPWLHFALCVCRDELRWLRLRFCLLVQRTASAHELRAKISHAMQQEGQVALFYFKRPVADRRFRW